jgi:hypothetical protein
MDEIRRFCSFGRLSVCENIIPKVENLAMKLKASVCLLRVAYAYFRV